MTSGLDDPAQVLDPPAWLGEVLGWRLTSATDRAANRGQDVRPYWALPSGHEPRLLVPRGWSGRGTLNSFNDSMSQPSRMKKAAFGLFLGLGTPWAPGADRIAAVTGDGDARDGGDGSLIGHLQTVVGGQIHVGATCGHDLRPNRKPVLQVVDGHGRIVAFAKIGWNEHTKGLVDREAAALAHLHGQRRTFSTPELMHFGEWNDRTVLVVSPGPRSLFRRGRRNALPSVEMELDVARTSAISTLELGSSPYLAKLRAKIQPPGISSVIAERLGSIFHRLVTRHGASTVSFGAWHGDWAPWNMIRGNDGLFVMDWERYEQGVPIGFDHLHVRFQLAHQVARRPLGIAAGQALASLRDAAPRSGIDEGTAEAVLTCYLMERVVRIEDGAAAGMPTRDSLARAILDHLDAPHR